MLSESWIGKNICLILIALCIMSPSRALSQMPTPTHQQKIIQINEVAPNSGVLVPFEDYYNYRSYEKQLLFIEQNPKPCENTTASWRDVGSWAGGGFLLGIIFGITFHK